VSPFSHNKAGLSGTRSNQLGSTSVFEQVYDCPASRHLGGDRADDLHKLARMCARYDHVEEISGIEPDMPIKIRQDGQIIGIAGGPPRVLTRPATQSRRAALSAFLALFFPYPQAAFCPREFIHAKI
jgi:hypothetical protein